MFTGEKLKSIKIMCVYKQTLEKMIETFLKVDFPMWLDYSYLSVFYYI